MLTTLARKAAAVALGAAAALTTAAALAPDAGAAPVLVVDYDASGSTLVAKPNSTIALGPTTLESDLNADGSFTGSLPLPPARASFKVLGLIPVTATVSFLPAGALTGQLDSTTVTATTTYTLKLTDVKLAGIPAFVGNRCETSSPAKISVATPKGQKFDIMKGGTVAGTYTIGKFGHCGLTTGLINLLVPGPNNTVSFTLSNGHLAGS